jgi:flagellar basal body-associated protein FliL
MAQEATQPPPSTKKSMVFTLVTVIVVAVLQAGVFFCMIKFVGAGPSATYGAADNKHVTQTEPAPAEAGSKQASTQSGETAAGSGAEKGAAGNAGTPAEKGPAAAAAAGSMEVVLLQRFKVPNNKSGVTIIYDFDISVVVSAAHKPVMEEAAKNRAAEISDRVAQVIRQVNPRVLEEDDFAALRELLKQALGEIVGDQQVIQRVLIPRCVPLRAG